MLATYVVGARAKHALGQDDQAAERLDEGERLAQALNLPRLAAHITAERIRSGIGASALSADSFPAEMPHDLPDGIVQVTAEKTEEAAIRALLAVSTTDTRNAACRRARALAGSIDATTRPRAELDARLLLAECLAASGSLAEAEELLLPILDRCARLGLVQPVLDAGSGVQHIVRKLGTTARRDVDPVVVRSWTDCTRRPSRSEDRVARCHRHTAVEREPWTTVSACRVRRCC